MIKLLQVSNYRSLGNDVRLPLGPFNILVGPNGAGKSNVLDVLSFVRDAMLYNLPAAVTHRGGIDSVRRRSDGRPFDMKIELDVTIKQYSAKYSFVVTGDRLAEYRVKAESAIIAHKDETAKFTRRGTEWIGPSGLHPRQDDESLVLPTLGGDQRFKALVDFLSRISIYSVFPDTLRMPQKFDPSQPMKTHGENWVSILRESVKTPEVLEDLVKGLNKLTGDIEDIRVKSAAGYLVVEFAQPQRKKKGKRWFPADLQSDGTLRFAGILTALLQTPPVPVIGIEEPELTVHPGAIGMLYEYLCQASDFSQVIISTHSPLVLDVANIERDSVFVVARQNNETRVRRMNETILEPVRASLMSLGDLMINGDLQLSLFGDMVDEI